MAKYAYSVGITLPDSTQMICGKLAIDEAGKGIFRYESTYLAHPDAYPLHPAKLFSWTESNKEIGLPLENRTFLYHHPSGLLPTFKNIIPEGWGKIMLINRYNLNQSDATPAKLLGYMKEDSIGALSFFKPGETFGSSMVSINHLYELINSAHRFINGEEVKNKDFQDLFKAGSSPAGGRPKVTIKDNDDNKWIAKFSQPRDSMQIIRIESAMLALAKQAGLEIPDFHIRHLKDKEALLIKRFDYNQTGGKHHVMSMRALMGLDVDNNQSYLNVFETIRHYSSRPAKDMELLARLMIFNILIANTDDHLKNISVIHSHTGWHLSPSYDLVPARANTLDGMGGGAPNRHCIKFIDDDIPVTKEYLVKQCKDFGLSKQKMTRIAEELLDTISQASDAMKKYSVDKKDRKLILKDMSKRIKLWFFSALLSDLFKKNEKYSGHRVRRFVEFSV